MEQVQMLAGNPIDRWSILLGMDICLALPA